MHGFQCPDSHSWCCKCKNLAYKTIITLHNHSQPSWNLHATHIRWSNCVSSTCHRWKSQMWRLMRSMNSCKSPLTWKSKWFSVDVNYSVSKMVNYYSIYNHTPLTFFIIKSQSKDYFLQNYSIYLFALYGYSVLGRMEWQEVGENCTMRKFTNYTNHQILVVKSEGKRPLVRPRYRWKGDIKMNLRELIWLWTGTGGELLWTQ
jgi:hypothetical protein